MVMAIEELTDEERAYCADILGRGHSPDKLWRIFDAHAVESAALTARVAELEREVQQNQRLVGRVEDQTANHLMAAWQALEWHEPADPYTSLTPEREAELLRARLAELEKKT
jgi:hypothetical protein